MEENIAKHDEIMSEQIVASLQNEVVGLAKEVSSIIVKDDTTESRHKILEQKIDRQIANGEVTSEMSRRRVIVSTKKRLEYDHDPQRRIMVSSAPGE